MSVKYVVTAKGNPLKPEEDKRFFASVVSNGEISLRELSRDISAISTVSTADVMAVLEGFIEVLPRKLAEGNIVRLGDFGSFRVTLKSDGQTKEEEVTADSITGVKLRFRPGLVLENSLATISFEKAE